MGGAVCVQSKDSVVPEECVLEGVCVCALICVSVCVCVCVHVCVESTNPLSIPHAMCGVCAEHR